MSTSEFGIESIENSKKKFKSTKLTLLKFAILGHLSTLRCYSYLTLISIHKCAYFSKLPDSQIDLHQLQSSQLVNNTYTDMMLVSGTDRNENHVPLTTTTNNVRNDDIYVENEDGEYDHLHSSRPKQVVSEREDERYATCTQLEDVSYSTVRKSRKSVPERDNENDNIAASFDSNFPSVANPDYEFCYLSSEIKDC